MEQYRLEQKVRDKRRKETREQIRWGKMRQDELRWDVRMGESSASEAHRPGQRAMLQSLLWVSGPSHALPPCWGGVHIRVRVRWPLPQVKEQRLHGDHSSHTPCTANRGQELRHIHTAHGTHTHTPHTASFKCSSETPPAPTQLACLSTAVTQSQWIKTTASFPLFLTIYLSQSHTTLPPSRAPQLMTFFCLSVMKDAPGGLPQPRWICLGSLSVLIKVPGVRSARALTGA